VKEGFAMTLSAVPYIGGKHRMAKYLSGMLDYSKTEYAEIFGGGARLLMNTAPFDKEYYFDTSHSMSAIMRVLSNWDTAMEFISRVEHLIVTEDFFEEMRDIKEKHEGSSSTYGYNKTLELLRKLDKVCNEFLELENEEWKTNFAKNLQGLLFNCFFTDSIDTPTATQIKIYAKIIKGKRKKESV